jgi:SAM-dependent methyltransferase
MRIPVHAQDVGFKSILLEPNTEATRLKSYEKLVSEAESASFSGWDFSRMKGRYSEPEPPWNYGVKVKAAVKEVKTMLDMGTGGGEVLSSLGPLPSETYATECWGPNVEVARRRLEPLGVKVVKVESEEHLPFDSDFFELVVNRHEEFTAGEVFRVIKPGGVFITQQVGGMNTDELNQLLQKRIHGEVTHPNPTWSLANAKTQLKDAGFAIAEGLEATYPSFFFDVGAVVYFLKHAPWEMPDFDTKKYQEPLRELHLKIAREGRLAVTTSRFFVKAARPE